MKIRHTSPVGGGGIVALVLSVNWCARILHAQEVSTPHDRNAAVLATLHDTIVDAAYDGEDLEDVFDGLREAHGLNIHVSWQRLVKVGMSKNDRLELKLNGVSLAQLLELIMREFEGDLHHPDYSVRDGIIIISSRDDLDRDTVVRTYDITDLMKSGYAIRRFANTPVLGLDLTGREYVGGEHRDQPSSPKSGGGGGGAGGGVFGEPEVRRAVMVRIQEVTSLLQDAIEPELWANNGGDLAYIHAYGNTLFIRHTVEGHRQIETMLAQMRGSCPAPLDAEVVVVRLRADQASQLQASFGPRYPRLGDSQISEVLDDEHGGELLFRATTSGHNGERIWFSALTQREVLAGMNASLSSYVSAFDPVTGVATEGLELIVLPLLDASGAMINLDVQMAWIPPSDVTQRAVSLGKEQPDATIDRVSRSMRTISSNVSLPLGEAIALSIPQVIETGGSVVEFEDWLILRVKKSD